MDGGETRAGVAAAEDAESTIKLWCAAIVPALLSARTSPPSVCRSSARIQCTADKGELLKECEEGKVLKVLVFSK